MTHLFGCKVTYDRTAPGDITRMAPAFKTINETTAAFDCRRSEGGQRGTLPFPGFHFIFGGRGVRHNAAQIPFQDGYEVNKIQWVKYT